MSIDNANDLALEAISRHNKKITNEIFLIIQNNRELMSAYLNILSNSDSEDPVKTINTTIGKAIKKSFNLNNLDDRNDDPSCTLIKSHQKFE